MRRARERASRARRGKRDAVLRACADGAFPGDRRSPRSRGRPWERWCRRGGMHAPIFFQFLPLYWATGAAEDVVLLESRGSGDGQRYAGGAAGGRSKSRLSLKKSTLWAGTTRGPDVARRRTVWGRREGSSRVSIAPRMSSIRITIIRAANEPWVHRSPGAWGTRAVVGDARKIELSTPHQGSSHLGGPARGAADAPAEDGKGSLSR